MTFGTHVAITVTVLTAAALVAACGGDSGGELRATLRATLTDDGCAYEGDVTPASGMFTVDVENRTAHFGAFALAAIADGSTIGELEAFLEQAERSFRQNGRLPEPPAFYSQVVRTGVAAESSGRLPADVPAGTYALMCFVDDLRTWRGHVAARLDVTGWRPLLRATGAGGSRPGATRAGTARLRCGSSLGLTNRSLGGGCLPVEEGSPAPDFTLASDTGEKVTLSALRGRPVVLYFYPKDDTPGCTTQACGMRDASGEFERRGVVVLGVSPDGEASHARFKAKHGLPFTLLADPDHAVAEAYGVWVEKSMYGKTYMGIERSTFVIDADGNVSSVMRKVKPDAHAEQVLAALP